ncbi:MAG: hypothetical protein GY849_21760 [Deltaproteobacteria bacterium]|nr:hypothetical protein [Deltaproteobacteria bacterium]
MITAWCREKALPLALVMTMPSLIKTMMVYFAAMMCLIGAFSPAIMAGGKIDLQITDATLSADLKDVLLKDIVKKIEEEKDIWFECDESLFERPVSVQFTELSLENGLKRVLASLNYSFVFHQDGSLIGVIILGRPGAVHQGKGIRKHSGNRYPRLSKAPKKPPLPRGPSKTVWKSPPRPDPQAAPIGTHALGDAPPPPDPGASPIRTRDLKGRPPPPVIPITSPLDMPRSKAPPPPGDPNDAGIDPSTIRNRYPPK